MWATIVFFPAAGGSSPVRGDGRLDELTTPLLDRLFELPADVVTATAAPLRDEVVKPLQWFTPGHKAAQAIPH